MSTRTLSLFLILILPSLVGCGGSTIVKTESTVTPMEPLRLIATTSNRPEFADFVAEELSLRGYGILNLARTTSALKKLDLDASEMEDVQNVIQLKAIRIDALMSIAVEMTNSHSMAGAVSLLDKVKVRVAGTKGGETLASLLWINSWGGMPGSPADSTMRLSMPAAARKVAAAIMQQLGAPGPRGTVFLDDVIAARKTRGGAREASAAPAPAELSSADIARIAKAVHGAAPSEAAAATAALPNSPSPSFQFPERPDDIAIVVGVETYSDLPKASYAERDATAVKAHLRALGVPERNIILLLGSKASKSSLEKNLELWLPRMVKPESRVYFYFSGHGAPDVKTGQAFLVPWDGDPNFLEATAYPVKKLYERLGALPAQQVLVAMDACFTGAGGRSVLASGARPLVGHIVTGSVSGKVTALTASSGSEISGSLDDKGHGAFTYFFLEGLDGAAKDASGHVTTKSLIDYITPRVKDEARRVNRDQTPQLLGADLTLR